MRSAKIPKLLFPVKRDSVPVNVIMNMGFIGMSTNKEALAEGDSEKYLQGNAAIQSQLGKQAEFETQNEFDDLMALDAPLKL